MQETKMGGEGLFQRLKYKYILFALMTRIKYKMEYATIIYMYMESYK